MYCLHSTLCDVQSPREQEIKGFFIMRTASSGPCPVPRPAPHPAPISSLYPLGIRASINVARVSLIRETGGDVPFPRHPVTSVSAYRGHVTLVTPSLSYSESDRIICAMLLATPQSRDSQTQHRLGLLSTTSIRYNIISD